MSKQDVYHDTVCEALKKDGWIITHDPYPLKFNLKKVYIDLGAEAPIGAEKGGKKIAVEIKSFVGTSEITDLERALGQYELYRYLLAKVESDRILYMAVPMDVYVGILSEPDSREMLQDLNIRIIAFDPIETTLEQWNDWTTTKE